MKGLNKTETPIFLSVVCSLFPKAIFMTFINIWMSNVKFHVAQHSNLERRVSQISNAVWLNMRECRVAQHSNVEYLANFKQLLNFFITYHKSRTQQTRF